MLWAEWWKKQDPRDKQCRSFLTRDTSHLPLHCIREKIASARLDDSREETDLAWNTVLAATILEQQSSLNEFWGPMCGAGLLHP
jgi:hypothetical protein